MNDTPAVASLGDLSADLVRQTLLDAAEIERLVAAIQAPARPLPTATPRTPAR